ncbi:hypothetical protein PYCC9005_002809 [Savitreella phatthalungensis]
MLAFFFLGTALAAGFTIDNISVTGLFCGTEVYSTADIQGWAILESPPPLTYAYPAAYPREATNIVLISPRADTIIPATQRGKTSSITVNWAGGFRRTDQSQASGAWVHC